MISFKEYDGKVPFELYDKFQKAYGAVVYGMSGTCAEDLNAVSKDEALEYATEFLKAFGEWFHNKKPTPAEVLPLPPKPILDHTHDTNAAERLRDT